MLISLRNAVLIRESVILKVLCAMFIKRYTEVLSVQGRWLRDGVCVCVCVCVCMFDKSLSLIPRARCERS